MCFYVCKYTQIISIRRILSRPLFNNFLKKYKFTDILQYDKE